MTSKVCLRCSHEKPLEEFYAHKSATDGRCGSCKVCTNAAARERRQGNPEKYRAYYRLRNGLPTSVSARAAYAATESGKDVNRKAVRSYAAAHPARRSANIALSNAIRDGRITRDPCHCCGAAEVEGHHADYSRPLDVTWLCIEHHNQLHTDHAARMREIAPKAS